MLKKSMLFFLGLSAFGWLPVFPPTGSLKYWEHNSGKQMMSHSEIRSLAISAAITLPGIILIFRILLYSSLVGCKLAEPYCFFSEEPRWWASLYCFLF